MIGIIGGTGVYDIVKKSESEITKTIETEYGTVDVYLLKIDGKDVAFLPRHSKGHSHPPHKINYKANISALKSIGVNQIIATNSVGSINPDMKPGDFVVVDDFIDFTVLRDRTFYDDKVVHIDMSEPYCNRMRSVIDSCGDVINYGTYVCSEGPRFETPAEIKMYKTLGGDLVGMTGLPELVLAREKNMCYSSICIVSNYGAGISNEKLSMEEVLDIMNEKSEELLDLIYNSVKALNEENTCQCLSTVE